MATSRRSLGTPPPTCQVSVVDSGSSVMCGMAVNLAEGARRKRGGCSLQLAHLSGRPAESMTLLKVRLAPACLPSSCAADRCLLLVCFMPICALCCRRVCRRRRSGQEVEAGHHCGRQRLHGCAGGRALPGGAWQCGMTWQQRQGARWGAGKTVNPWATSLLCMCARLGQGGLKPLHF